MTSMTLTEALIREIEAFLKRYAMSATAFGTLSCGDKHVVRRLRRGRSITLRRADELRTYMQRYARRRDRETEAA